MLYVSVGIKETKKKKKIVTGVEKWIHYDKAKRKILYANQIDSKAEYSWFEGNAVYMVGSERCAIL